MRDLRQKEQQKDPRRTPYLGYDELDLLLHQLALLPGDGLALLGPGPDLLPVLVRLPVGDAVWRTERRLDSLTLSLPPRNSHSFIYNSPR